MKVVLTAALTAVLTSLWVYNQCICLIDINKVQLVLKAMLLATGMATTILQSVSALHELFRDAMRPMFMDLCWALLAACGMLAIKVFLPI